MYEDKIKAEVILASHNTETDDTIITFKLTYPRIILAEVLTHKLFSRNTASSRAVPVEKMIARVENNPFIPEYWGKNKKGMAASEEIPQENIQIAKNLWGSAAMHSIAMSTQLSSKGVHKQLANRLTEPFQIIEQLVTATCFNNWYALRNNKAAQPEIQCLAQKMLEASVNCRVDNIIPGNWHLPFITEDEKNTKYLDANLIVSAARCARVSYYLQDGNVSDFDSDFKLAQRLITQGHFSPLEHVAMAMSDRDMVANFIGWLQLRKLFINESGGDLDDNVNILNPHQARKKYNKFFPDLNYLL